MAAPKSRPRGRPRGIPNKDRDEILGMLRLKAKAMGKQGDFDPLVCILELLLDPNSTLTDKDRMFGHSTLAEYVHSKRKAIEVTGNVAQQQTIIFGWATDDGEEAEATEQIED